MASNEEILVKQQEQDDSGDEYLPENEQVVDSNDVTNLSIGRNLDLNVAKSDRKLWLMRVPKYLLERWSADGGKNFNGQAIGQIKARKPPNGQPFNINSVKELKLQLNPADALNEDLPHSYNLRVSKPVVANEYAFTEENLNFNNFNNNSTPTSSTGRAAYVKSEQAVVDKVEMDEGVNRASNIELKPLNAREEALLKRRKRKFNRYKNDDGSNKTIPFVKTIPKKTALVGRIVHETTLLPDLRDPNYNKIINKRKSLLTNPSRSAVTVLDEIPGVTFSKSSFSLIKTNDNSKFLKNATNAKQHKLANNEGRAIRMNQKDLFDLLFKLFDEYDYWSLKGLKERTRQPEVYLKETLEQIAVLIKKGPYALKYCLKREYKELKDQERADKLGGLDTSTSTNNNQDDDDDNSDVEMEDVV